MDNQNFYGNKELEFRQLILEHIKHILNLSLRSNQDGQNAFLYINSIEALSDVLLPFYDDKMNKAFESFQKQFELIIKENKQKREELCEGDYSRQYAHIFVSRRRRVYRELFRDLNLLLKRNDYLKTSVFGESRDEVIEDEEE
jgi:hypothetical protein